MDLAQIAAQAGETTRDRVHVAVDEAGEHRAPAELDDLSARTAQRGDLVPTDREDAPVADRDDRGRRTRIVHRVHDGIDQQQIGLELGHRSPRALHRG